MDLRIGALEDFGLGLGLEDSRAPVTPCLNPTGDYNHTKASMELRKDMIGYKHISTRMGELAWD